MKEGWSFKSVKDVAQVIAGQSPEGRYYNTEGVGLPFYQGKKDFGEKYIKPSGVWTSVITKTAIAGDILMSVRAPVGPVNVSVGEICIGRGLAAIRQKDNVLHDFLFYFFKYYEGNIKGNTGAVFDSINKAQIENIPFLIPPFPEQQRIVSIIDKSFEAIDKAIENTQKNLQNAKELFESYLNNVFENGGEGWMECKVKEIGFAQTGTTPKTAMDENYGNFIPFVKPADIDYSGIGDIRYNNEGLSEIGLKHGRKMLSGSILMVCIGATIGKVGFAVIDVSCNQQINSLTVDKVYEPKFIYYAMRSKQFQEKILSEGKGAQATLPIINKSKWENLNMVIPKSKATQQSIVRILDDLLSEIKNLEANYQQKLRDLEELKKSILNKAFAGEL